MGYDAVNIGPNDLAAGISFFNELDAPPLVSANLFDGNGRELFLPQIIKQVGSLRYGITGVTRKPENLDNSFMYEEWRDVLPDIINSLSGQSDFIILLSALDKTENTAIAERFPKVRIILSSGPDSIPNSSGVDNNTLFTQTIDRGRHLGQMRVDHPEHSQWQNTTQKLILQLQQHLDMLTQRAKTYRNQSADAAPKNSQQVLARLQGRIDHTSTRLQKLKQSLPENSQLPASTYTLRHIPLTSSIAEHPQIEGIIDNINKEVKAVKNKQRQKRRQS